MVGEGAEEAEEYKALLRARRLYEDGLAKLHEGEYEPAGGERNARYSIDENFASNYDKWVADGRSGGKSIKVGRTSEALQSVGVRENQVRIDTSKINKIQQKHPAMSDDVIKKVPEILEKPIVIMESLGNKDSKKPYNNRLTLFGEVMDTEGKNVLAVLELEPTDRDGNMLNLTKIASTYGKNAQYLLDNSRVLYIEPNKKRTDDWLRLLGLQLPVGLTNQSGSIGKIAYNNPAVNSQNKRFSIDSDIRYSIDDVPSVRDEESETSGDSNSRYEELINRYGRIEPGMEKRKSLIYRV